jgi:hypothetical protein
VCTAIEFARILAEIDFRAGRLFVAIVSVCYSLGKSATTLNVGKRADYWSKQCYYEEVRQPAVC